MEPYAAGVMPGVCPDRDRLFEFDLGRLPEPELVAIAEHLSSCDRCADSLHALRPEAALDPAIALIRISFGQPALSDQVAYDRMEAHAFELRTAPDSSNPTASAWEETADHQPGRPADLGFQVRTIGQYELLECLGEGGMGVVHRAYQIPLQRMVALKMIRAGSHADARTLARFRREGQAVARLQHTNIVQVYEFGEADGHPFFSMELIEGGNLQARLNRGPFEFREAAELSRVLAEAVAYAHGRGVVHRDLKPANVLLDASGTPRITDFGLAKFLDPDVDKDTPATDLTETGSVMGTASYMAPEQAEGRSDVGAPADVYALGAILYALLTGVPPFVGETKLKTLELVRSAQPAPPSRVRKGVPFGIQSICLKCLEKSPARRFASAQDMADDLGRWLNEERPHATPGLLTRVRRGARRNRVAVAAGTVLLMVGMTLSTLGVTAYRSRPDFVIQQIEGELAHGRGVVLIGPTGPPKWSRRLTGKSKLESGLAYDHVFSIRADETSRVELLPDPQCERYRFSARVRHEMSKPAGQIGFYFARTTYPGVPGPASSPILFFTDLTFNDRIDFDLPRQMVAQMKGLSFPPLDNTVVVSTSIHSGDKWQGRGRVIASGPHFKVHPQEDPRWHDVEVVVTPERLNVLWDGQPLSVPLSVIQNDTIGGLTAGPPGIREPVPRDFRPAVKARGGLGLIISCGAAAFKDVKVTPL